VLGYGFVPTYKKGEKGKYQLVADKKALERLKLNIKTITRKTSPLSFEERIEKLNEIQRGWVNYFQSDRRSDGKYLQQAQGDRRMDTKPPAPLHLA